MVTKWGAIIEEIKKRKLENVLFIKLADFNPTILSEKRKELLQVIREKNIESETQLADMVHRQRENVLADLKILEYYGLIERQQSGNKVIPKDTKATIIITE